MPTISSASTPSRSVMMKACNMDSNLVGFPGKGEALTKIFFSSGGSSVTAAVYRRQRKCQRKAGLARPTAHPDSEAALLKIRLLKISIAVSLAQLDALQPLWNELYRLSQKATMFQKFQWNRLAAEFFELRERPYVVAVRNSGGAAIIPACIAGGEIKFLGEKLFDYPAPLCAGEPAARDIAWEQLLSLRLPLRVSGIREADAAWPASAAAWTGAPFVSRELTSQQFSALHLNSARRARRLLRLGVTLKAEIATDSLVRQLYNLKARTA